MAPPKSLPDDVLLNVIEKNNVKILDEHGILFKEKDKNGPWGYIQTELANMNYHVTTKNLHNKFNRKIKGKQSKILQEYKKRLENRECLDCENEIISMIEKKTSFQSHPEHSFSRQNKDLDDHSPEPKSVQAGDHRLKNFVSSESQEICICDLTELHRMKVYAFEHSIKHIGALPFQLFYWNPEQIFLWKKFVTDNNYPVVFTFLDDVTEKFMIPDFYRSQSVYLFFLSIKVFEEWDEFEEPVIITLAQALTEKPNIEFFVKFISEYVREADQPGEIICSFSSMIMDAFSLVFNRCWSKDYVEDCYSHLKNLNSNFSKTFIYVDRVSLLSSISQLTSFLKIDSESKQRFYLGCFMYLSTINSVKKFFEAAKNIITLMISPTHNCVVQNIIDTLRIDLRSPDVLEIKNNFVKHKNLISKQHEFMKFEFDSNDVALSMQTEVDSLETFVNLIFENAQSSLENLSSSDHPNAFYINNDQWMKDCKGILFYFPMWTSVIQSRSNFLTDASIFYAQSHLKFICNEELLNLNSFEPIRIPYFLKHHFERIEQLSDLGLQIVNQDKRNLINMKDYNNNNGGQQFRNLEENWMGQNDTEEKNEMDAEEIFESSNSNDSLESSSFEEEDLSLDPNYHSTPIKQKKLVGDERNTAIQEYAVRMFSRLENKEIKVSNKSRKRKRAKTNKRQGKYTTANPNLKIAHYQKTTNKLTKEKFISNHNNFKGPRLVGQRFVKIGNSSILDVILEMFSFAFRYFNTFQSYYINIDCKEENCFLKKVVDWCKTGNHVSLYNYITQTLDKIFNPDGLQTRITINKKVGEFFSEINANHFSILGVFQCHDCNSSIADGMKVIEIPSLNNYILDNLQKEIKVYMNDKKCKKCMDSRTNVAHCEYGQYLFLDFENTGSQTFLNAFPEKILLDTTTFILTGIIGYKFKQDKNQIYIAYTRFISGDWREINGTKKKKMTVLRKIPKVYITGVLYINVTQKV